MKNILTVNGVKNTSPCSSAYIHCAHNYLLQDEHITFKIGIIIQKISNADFILNYSLSDNADGIYKKPKKTQMDSNAREQYFYLQKLLSLLTIYYLLFVVVIVIIIILWWVFYWFVCTKNGHFGL